MFRGQPDSCHCALSPHIGDVAADVILVSGSAGQRLDRGAWCRVTPGREFYYDGITLNPFEVMFVPMDTIAVENGWTFAKLASVYASWLSIQVSSSCLAWAHDRMPEGRLDLSLA